jgi:hypothetical protein
VSDSYASRIVTANQDGSFQVTLGADPLGNNCTSEDIKKCSAGERIASFRGVSSFRPVESGFYKVFFIHTKSKKLVSNVHKIHVQVCKIKSKSHCTAQYCTVHYLVHIKSLHSFLPLLCFRCVETVFPHQDYELLSKLAIANTIIPKQKLFPRSHWCGIVECLL